MRIGLLGQLLVEDGAVRMRRNDFPTRQTRIVFAYLTLHADRLVDRAELAKVLWTDRPPPTWKMSVSAVVSKLRAAIDTAGLETRMTVVSSGSGYRLRLPDDAVVDVRRAGDLLSRAAHAFDGGQTREARAAALEAAGMVRRGLLSGERGHWLDEVRADGAIQLARALDVATRSALSLGDHDAALSDAMELVRLEPLDEAGYRAAMRAHLGAGNRSAALRMFERCRRICVEELGVNPSPETEALYLEALSAGTAVRQLPLPVVVDPDELPFVGRVEALGALRAAYRAVRGEARLAVVRGEAGIGKTRLVEEFAAEVHEGGATVLFGRCDEDLVVPYRPVAEALEHLVLSCPPDELAAVLGSGAAELSRLVPEILERLGEVVPRPPADPDEQRLRLFDAVRAVLYRLRRDVPAVLIVEDVHWADDASLLLIRQVLRTAAPLPLLVVLTYRDTDTPPGTPLEALVTDVQADGRATLLDLEGLRPDDVRLLVGTCADASEMCLLTAGNPLFVRELLRDRGEARTVARLDSTSIRALVMRRTRRLSHDAQDVLAIAALAGSDAEIAVIAEVCERRREDVGAALDEALAAKLLTEAGVPGRYRFSHAIVRTAVEASLLPARRCVVHQRLAQSLERRGLYGPRAAAVAHHYANSSDPADLPRAVRAARLAGTFASEQLGHAEAVIHFRRALELLDRTAGDHLTRAELLMLLGEASIRVGADDAAVSALSCAADLARRWPAPSVLARCALSLADVWAFTGRVESARIQLLTEAIELLGSAEPALSSGLLARLATELYYEENSVEQRDMLTRRAVELARQSGEPTALAAALHARAYATWATGGAAERLATGDEILRLSRGRPELALEGLAWRITGLLERGASGPLARAVADYEALAVQLRQPRYIWYAQTRRAMLGVLQGRFDEAMTLAGQARDLAADVGQADANNVYLAVVAPAIIFGGTSVDLVPMVGHAESTQHHLGLRSPSTRYVTAVASAAAAAWGDHDTATRLAAAVDLCRHHDDLVSAATLALRAWVAWASSDSVTAKQLYRLLEPLNGTQIVAAGGVAFWGAATHWLGLLAATLGDIATAEVHLRSALTAHDLMGALPFAWFTRVALADLLTGTSPDEAAAMRREAERIADTVRINPHLPQSLRR